ncbi:Peptidase family M48 [Rhodospirillales bacterium URHD0017]|nr:Peptidase family M48 [Rhodospirillales bacterium URHD0017]
MQRRSFMALAGSGLVCGCGAVHQLPVVSDGNIAMAQAEVRTASPPQRRWVSDDEAAQTLRTAIQLVRMPAINLCHQMNVGVCDWKFRMSRARDLNAGAMGYGQIVLNRGIVEYANNEEEVCLVVAHEIGHHAANHIARGTASRMIGALIGVAVVGVVAVATGSDPGRDIVDSAAQLGATIGGLSYSKEQEREADYMAALILYRAGLDLDKARGLLVTMASGSGRMETTFLDTHPAGPERLAAWDRAAAEIRASNGRVPQRA